MSDDTRVITRTTANGQQIAVVQRSPENESMTDEELFAELDEWQRGQRHLRAVEDPE
jgi:hypothetical protein